VVGRGGRSGRADRLDQDTARQPTAHAEPTLTDLADQRVAVGHNPQRTTFQQPKLTKSLSLRGSVINGADSNVITSPES